MSYLNEKSVPLWLQVSKAIEKDIEEGVLKPGDKLAGEFELCNIYNVSRITVRGALARLSDLGLVKRIKGNGTVVANRKINEPLLKIEGFTDEMKKKGIIPGTTYAHIQRKRVSGYIAELFGKSQSTMFNVLERVRSINGVPVGYYETVFNDSVKLSYDDSQYYVSLYEKLKNENGIVIDKVVQKVSADFADLKTRERLGIDSRQPVLVMKRWAYSNGKLIEYSVCKYDGQKYEYEFELREE